LFIQNGRGGKGGRGERSNDGAQTTPFDKKYWKDKECYKYHKKGHPATHCTNKPKDDDEKSLESTKSNINKLKKNFKTMKKAFTTVNTQLEKLKEADSDISDSETKEETSHFQYDHAFQFACIGKQFEPRIAKLFQSNHSNMKLDLKEVILLDSGSTIDLFCNSSMVMNTIKSPSTLKLKSNGGNMSVTRKASLPGYDRPVWFSSKAITNIIALCNIIRQYHVTYNSHKSMFVVHRENRPNMEFRMHESGLHYFDPRTVTLDPMPTKRKHDKVTFLNTVSENKEGFTLRQIKGAQIARTLYSTLCYPSISDYKWVIRSNQIKDCPVTVQDVNVASTIWGKDIAALKGKTVCNKTIPVARDYVKVPHELLKLHKEVFMIVDIFFVNKIPFFLSLSRKICFTTVSHLSNRTVPQIFKAFREIYQYYLQRGFCITTVHADGKFAPLKALIESLPGGRMVNLASANEHVPEIKRQIRVVKERCRAI
jgi:hypothetical protein